MPEVGSRDDRDCQVGSIDVACRNHDNCRVRSEKSFPADVLMCPGRHVLKKPTGTHCQHIPSPQSAKKKRVKSRDPPHARELDDFRIQYMQLVEKWPGPCSEEYCFAAIGNIVGERTRTL